MREVVITGIGLVTSLGIGRGAYAQALRDARSGIGDLTLFAPPGNCEHAGEIDDAGYDWRDYIFSRQTYADRCTQLAAGAARLALDDSGLVTPLPEDGASLGLAFGSCWGAFEAVGKFFEPLAAATGKSVSSLVFSHSYPNSPPSLLAIEMGLRGYSTNFSGSHLAGFWALRSAFDALVSGAATGMLVGAGEALQPLRLADAEAAGRLPNTAGLTPPETMPSFGDTQKIADWARVPGEGSVFFVLENAATAKKRGASVLGILSGVRDSSKSTPDSAMGINRVFAEGGRCGDGLSLNGLMAIAEWLLAPGVAGARVEISHGTGAETIVACLRR